MAGLYSICFIQEEKAYLKNEIDSSHTEDKKKLPVPPYGRILTSVPFLAMVLTNTTMSWGMNTLMTEVPTYLNNVQHIPLTLVRSFQFHLIVLENYV